MDLDCSLQFADSICQIHGVDDGIESDGGDDDCVDGDDDNNANILYLRLLVVGGQWSLIADTQVMSSHSYLDSLLLHSQMKVIQVQNYNISDVFSFFIVQIIKTELPNTPAGYTMHNLLCVQQNYQVLWIGEEEEIMLSIT